MFTTDTIIEREFVRDTPDGSRVVATLKIDHIKGNAHPHFSATCEVYHPVGHQTGASRHERGREPDAFGACHDVILDAFPELAPLVAMHLSDWPSGVPMHAESNSFYFASNGHLDYELRVYGVEYVERHGTGRERAARVLRCSVDDLPEVVWSKDQWSRFIDGQRDRWAREAQDAYELLESIPT